MKAPDEMEMAVMRNDNVVMLCFRLPSEAIAKQFEKDLEAELYAGTLNIKMSRAGTLQ